MIYHLDIVTHNDYTCKVQVKINNNVVNENYFSRNMVKVVGKPASGQWVMVTFNDGSDFILTHNQNNEIDSVYIVDTIDGVQPTSMFDLAEKINALFKF